MRAVSHSNPRNHQLSRSEHCKPYVLNEPDLRRSGALTHRCIGIKKISIEKFPNLYLNMRDSPGILRIFRYKLHMVGFAVVEVVVAGDGAAETGIEKAAAHRLQIHALHDSKNKKNML